MEHWTPNVNYKKKTSVAREQNAMSSMRYISSVPSGYLVRKAVNGRLYQSFFGETRYGDNEKALEAAIAYRDELLKQVANQRSFQRHNTNNVTGVVGVAWHCRINTHRNGAVIHSFRAQVANENDKALSKAWSIPRHGLWGAYEQAVRWRNMIAFGKAISHAEIVKPFLGFMTYYLEQMETQDIVIRMEMTNALAEMAASGDAPKSAIAMIPSSIRRRLGGAISKSRKKASRNTRKSQEAVNNPTDLYDTGRASIL